MVSEAETTILSWKPKNTGRPARTSGRKDGFSPAALRESAALPAPGLGTCSLQNRETINFCCSEDIENRPVVPNRGELERLRVQGFGLADVSIVYGMGKQQVSIV